MKRRISERLNTLHYYSLFVGLSILMILMCSLMFLASGYFIFRSDVEDAIREQNNRAKNRFLESILQTEYVTKRIATQILFYRSNHKSSDLKFINTILVGYRNSVNELISWSTLSWADKNHDLVVSSNVGIMKDSINMSHRDYIPLTEKYPQQVHLGKPVIGVVSKLWSIPIGYGVVDKRGNYLGSVISGMVIDGLREYVTQSINDPNVAFAILDKNNEILTKSESFDLKKAKKFFRELEANGHQGYFYYGNGFYQKVDSYPFGIVTFYRHDALKQTTIRLTIFGIVISLITLLVGFIFLFFYRNFLMPVFELLKLAAKVSRGEKLSDPIPEFKIFEINELAKIVRKTDEK